MEHESDRPDSELVGLVPAAGYATRLGDVAGSKPAQEVLHDGSRGPVAASALEQMRRAGVSRVFTVIREGKWDIPAALGDGTALGLPLAYLVTPGTGSVPETLDVAYPFVRQATVALAWPDVLYAPPDALARTVAHLGESGADVALGLFPTTQGDRFDGVDLDEAGVVQRLAHRPDAAAEYWTWTLAGWGPRFTEFLHARLAALDGASDRELPLSEVFQAAIDSGLRVTATRFPEGRFLDVGTPDDLAAAQGRQPPSDLKPEA